MMRKRRKIVWIYTCLGLCALCLCIRALLQYYENVRIRANLRPGEYYVNTGGLDLAKFLSAADPTQNGGSYHRNNTRIGRVLPDTRPTRCRQTNFKSYLPKASVIIVFSDEDRMVLLNTIYSVLLRSPNELLGEIILVDDFGSDSSVGKSMARFSGVKTIRTSKREGLIRCRNLGAREASYPVLVFLESSCEVNVGWLQPLLSQIAQSPNSVVCPVNDIIRTGSALYVTPESDIKGGFEWDLTFKPERTHFRDEDFIRSPILVGNIFAVKKQRFTSLGLFDKDMEDAGGETIELSLKAWLCGGEVAIIPCSRVGVLESKSKQKPDNGNIYTKNVRRVAEALLDDYKRFFYYSKPSARMTPLQSVLERKAIKNHLKCKGFKWFLENVYPELRLPATDELAYGQIRQERLCLDIAKGQAPAMAKLSDCNPDTESQNWILSRQGEISSHGMCLTADGIETHGYVLVHLCNKDRTQKWRVHKKQIYREGTSECLDSHKAEVALVISQCDDLYSSQIWRFSGQLAADQSSQNKDDF